MNRRHGTGLCRSVSHKKGPINCVKHGWSRCNVLSLRLLPLTSITIARFNKNPSCIPHAFRTATRHGEGGGCQRWAVPGVSEHATQAAYQGWGAPRAGALVSCLSTAHHSTSGCHLVVSGFLSRFLRANLRPGEPNLPLLLLSQCGTNPHPGDRPHVSMPHNCQHAP